MNSTFEIVKKSTSIRFLSLIGSTILILDTLTCNYKSISLIAIDNAWIKNNVSTGNILLVVCLLSIFFVVSSWIKDIYDIFATHTIFLKYYLGKIKEGYIKIDLVGDLAFATDNGQLYDYYKKLLTYAEKSEKNIYSGTYLLLAIFTNYLTKNPITIFAKFKSDFTNNLKSNSFSSLDNILFLFIIIVFIYSIADFVIPGRYYYRFVYFPDFGKLESDLKTRKNISVAYQYDKINSTTTL